MAETTKGTSILNEIRKIEDSISTCYERVYVLKAKLKSTSLTSEQKDGLRQELLEVEKLLSTNKTILKTVHKDNRNTFYVASALCIVIFIIWMLYCLAFGSDPI